MDRLQEFLSQDSLGQTQQGGGKRILTYNINGVDYDFYDTHYINYQGQKYIPGWIKNDWLVFHTGGEPDKYLAINHNGNISIKSLRLEDVIPGLIVDVDTIPNQAEIKLKSQLFVSTKPIPSVSGGNNNTGGNLPVQTGFNAKPIFIGLGLFGISFLIYMLVKRRK